jgi:hypothetical protein
MFATGDFMHENVRYSCKIYVLIVVISFLTCTSATPVVAAGPTVERTASLSLPGSSDTLKHSVEDRGYRVLLDDGWTAEFWFARTLATATKDSPGALYPELTNGELAAVVNFAKGSSDYRGQPIPAGTYTLRYQYLPQDANHMGVSPSPDFLLAIPVAADPDPAAQLPFKTLVSLSAKTTGTAHPAVIAMAPARAPGTVEKDDQGMTVLSVAVPGPTGKSEKFGIVLKGQATQ